MTDIVDTATRSRMMAAIKRGGTQPELQVRHYLHACGLRFRVHDRRLPGTPDIVLARFHAAIFVHGCFWHRHPGCRLAAVPATRAAFWNQKFERNVCRDAESASALASLGWRPLVIWECETRDADHLDLLFWRIVSI